MKRKLQIVILSLWLLLNVVNSGFLPFRETLSSGLISYGYAQSQTCNASPSIFFVHGLSAQSKDSWQDGTIKQVLEENDYQGKLIVFSYPPLENSSDEDTHANIIDSAQKLAVEIEDESKMVCSGEVHVIAHSLGGLITRQYLSTHMQNHKIGKFIDIATPHSGSAYIDIFNDIPSKWRDGLYNKLKEKIDVAVDPRLAASQQIDPDSDFIHNLSLPGRSPFNIDYHLLYGEITTKLSWDVFGMTGSSEAYNVGDIVVASTNASTIPNLEESLVSDADYKDTVYESYKFSSSENLMVDVSIRKNEAGKNYEIRNWEDVEENWHSGLVENSKVNQQILEILKEDFSLTTEPPVPVEPVSSTILVFDTSGSMEDQDISGITKLEAAVYAGDNILEIIAAEAQAGVGAGNQVGVVDFNEDARVGIGLTTDMAAVQSALSYLYADGGTALPKGLETAINLSKNSAQEGHPIIILLSDGIPNIGLNYEEDELVIQQQALDLASIAGSSGICVYTVGFGVPGTLGDQTGDVSINEEFLTAVAERSGCGKYYNAQSATELANIYINLRHESVGDIQFQKNGQISQDEQVEIGSVDIPANQDMMLFTLKWPGSQLDPVLIDPTGRSVDSGYPGASISQTSSLATVIIQSPKAGRWRLGAKGVEVPQGTTNYSAVLSTRIGDLTSAYRVTGNRNTPPIILLIVLVVVGGGFVYVVSKRKIKAEAYLQITSAADGLRQVQIYDRFVIGRSKFTQLQLFDRSVSRRHVSIRYVKGAWFIQDLSSSGGTFVNGQRIQAARLNNGDHIRIGNSTMTFQC